MFAQFRRSVSVFLSFFLITGLSNVANSDHLHKKSDKEVRKIHDLRLSKIPSLFEIVTINPTVPSQLVYAAQPNDNVKQIMERHELLSVMFFDGANVTTDELNSRFDFKNDQQMYSMSIAKSIVGYMLGHAVCEGHIKSLDDKLGDYVPEAKGTVYENETIRNISNMSAHDAGYTKKVTRWKYTTQVVNLRGTKPVSELLRDAAGVKMSQKAKFEYHGLKSDLIARLVDISVPNGLDSYAQEKVSTAAGFSKPMSFLRDAKGWPIGLAWFYLNREDFLKFGIRVSRDWNEEGCIGKYLKASFHDNVDGNKYGSFFWYETGEGGEPIIEMRGHGGQRVIVNTASNEVLSYLSIRAKYSQEKLRKQFSLP